MDEESMKHVINFAGGKNPFNKMYKFYALIEVASNVEGKENVERLLTLFQQNESSIIVNLEFNL